MELWTNPDPVTKAIWKFIPVNIDNAEGTFTPSQSSSDPLGSGPLPSYDGGTTGQSSARTQHTESDRDDFGTIVTEVTIVTTRRKYRVEDA